MDTLKYMAAKLTYKSLIVNTPLCTTNQIPENLPAEYQSLGNFYQKNHPVSG
jgi:hypothetical protein